MRTLSRPKGSSRDLLITLAEYLCGRSHLVLLHGSAVAKLVELRTPLCRRRVRGRGLGVVRGRRHVFGGFPGDTVLAAEDVVLGGPSLDVLASTGVTALAMMLRSVIGLRR